MAYQKQEWKDLPDRSTPITSERLNHIEDGIFQNSNILDKLKNEIFNQAYPIGISIMFEDNEDHSKFLGFTWERNLTNLTPIGCNESGSNVGEEKGNERHSHYGGIITANYQGKGYIGISNSYAGYKSLPRVQGAQFYGCERNVNGVQGEDMSTYATEQESSYQPSKVVAYWKRVA